ncbi:flagellar hook assembly protein FlgD [Virgibacillus proomii]|uniref:flagellar hook assembly protein FlgD n=1 Tax=Virgibacillus proomii TaxID=84407 RepID=UPI0009860BDE|nr:flagellar hook assembly protein FlgD [Virgibacillus proomii]
MAKIDPSLYLRNQKQERTPNPDLGKDEFLKILMVQLQNQDPTNPMDDREFIAQMAQFSSLEQMMNMSKSIDNLVESQLVSPVIKYSHMLGREVTYQAYDKETGKKTEIVSSKVVAVSQKDGWAILELENGEKIYADAVLQVNDPESKKDDEQPEESKKEGKKS